MNEDTYTLVATSAFVAPEIHKHLTKSQAQSLAWEYKAQQYKVTIELEESLVEIGVCSRVD